MNSITQKKFTTSWQYVYGFLLMMSICACIGYAATYPINYYLDQQIQQLNVIYETEQAKIEKLGGSHTFDKYMFANQITTKNTKRRSTHLGALFDVLKTIQQNSYQGSEAIVLSNFSITPEKISLEGTVTNLVLLYHSSPKLGYVSVIDRFAQLPFVQKVYIQQYTRSGKTFSFTLHADIELNDTTK